MSAFVKTGKGFSIPVDRDNLTLVRVLAVLGQSSGPHSWGATRDTFDYYSLHLHWDTLGVILVELEKLGLLTVSEHQSGTAGIMDKFYKLVDGCTVEMVINVPAPIGGK